MGKKDLKFSGILCYLDDKRISIDEFKNTIQDSKQYEQEEEKEVHIFETNFFENRFLTIKILDGTSIPRNPKVYNTSKHSLQDNPRQRDQIEPKEYFAIIDFNTSILWMSSINKKKLVKKFFKKEFFKKELLFKDIYNEKEFIKHLKQLNEIKVSAVPNILSQTNTLSAALTDEMYPAAKAELKLSYDINIKNSNSPPKILNKILDNQDSFKNITIMGRNENEVDILFNKNIVMEKITLKLSVNEDGMFSTDDVFKKMISEIKCQKDEDN